MSLGIIAYRASLRDEPVQSVMWARFVSVGLPPPYNSCMSIPEQVQKDMTAAMRAREELRLSTLRMVKAAFKNKEVEKRAPLDEKEVASRPRAR